MSQDIAGRAFKNVSGSPILITDVATIEIPADGTVSLLDYPVLERSTHLRRFISLNYLIEDPSRGMVVGPQPLVTMQQSFQPPPNRELTEAEISRIADRVAKALVPTIEGMGVTSIQTPTSQQPTVEKPDWDVDRAQIIDRAIRTIGPVTERFGDVTEVEAGDGVDVGKLIGGLRPVVGHDEPRPGEV